ncbi:hypothetical protein ZIOFF_053911 [Zingiber officinale]|uniref:Uncharacterized protein n=1 Tax=Zingiber officinale TaxID=94328 RepID=A0A8J5KP03_ZINOF|nr:hypothetical protein ZIOFF_053911 [Zingiber officinale]
MAFEKNAYTLDKAPPKEAPVNNTPDALANLEIWWDHNLQARCYMLISMSNELQWQFEETMDATDIHKHLQELYGTQIHSLVNMLANYEVTMRKEKKTIILLGSSFGSKKRPKKRGKNHFASTKKIKPNKKPMLKMPDKS